MKALRIRREAWKSCTLCPPLSKSDAQRAMVVADIWGLPSPVPPLGAEGHEDLPRDVQVMAKGLQALAGPGPRLCIDCKDGGAPFRFLLTQAALRPDAEVEFVGSTRLGERPHEALLSALEQTLGPLGLRIERGNPWPLRLHTPQLLPKALHMEVEAQASSQFASSLLLGAARVARASCQPSSVFLRGPLASPGYWDMTRKWLECSGFSVWEENRRTWVTTKAMPQQLPPIPGDWSSLGYLLLLGWASNNPVAGVSLGQGHPDEALWWHLQNLGLETVCKHNLAHVSGQAQGGLKVSALECPDAVLGLVALACMLKAPSRFEDIAVLRLKESDRVEAAKAMATAFGAVFRLEGDSFVVEPGPLPKSFELDSREDHRMAMSAATLAAMSGVPLQLWGPECVEKSFPAFWKQLQNVGVGLFALRAG
ncbi:MAG: 3-phosphoshikimate 1-carboxyvinyltransferase [Cystobacterineae bacterium]|nr:3-phosphoshikimate 1-carboxyvinyltransferase [Cystobacterineae bacterium]